MTPILLVISLLPFAKINAQVGIGTTNPSNSAVLHLESSNKGVLFPRMTTIQRTGIDPVNGLIVFDTDSSTLYIYQEPAGWKQIKAIASLKDIVSGVLVFVIDSPFQTMFSYGISKGKKKIAV